MTIMADVLIPDDIAALRAERDQLRARCEMLEIWAGTDAQPHQAPVWLTPDETNGWVSGYGSAQRDAMRVIGDTP
jgi:hypothetical protein